MTEITRDGLKTIYLPMLALRGLSVFPSMLLNFDVERKKSVAALNSVADGDRRIFLVAQKDIAKEDPSPRDLYTVGTLCKIRQILRLPGGGVRVMVDGIRRAKLVNIVNDDEYFLAEIETFPVDSIVEKFTPRLEATIRKALELFDQYSVLTSNVTPETVLSISASINPGYIADFITQNVYLKPEQKQQVLEVLDPIKRLRLVCHIMTHELEVIEIEQNLNARLRDRLASQQKDNVLREQMRIIQSELGEDDSDSEITNYRGKVHALNLPEEMEAKLMKDIDRLQKQPFGSSEASVLRGYLDICVELPWNKTTKERLDIKSARRILDDDHFGLDKVKERIIEFLAVKQLAPDIKGTILCFVGPPGVGKTSVAISIARALNRKLARLSLGGIHDEAEIRGHRKTYVGAMPGRIISAINQAGSKNPLILLDEIDKLGSDYRGDPAAALLEALDPEQNGTFRDHFLELPFDLSDVLFITTANTTSTIPRPLLDRMEVIELSSYTDNEKLEIAKRHLIPKQRKKHGLTARQMKIGDDVILDIIAGYTRESGVRILERELAKACRRTAAKIASDELKSANIKSNMLEDFLGVRKYRPDTLHAKDEIGIVRGLAWTSVGGETLEIEVSILDGTGKLELTGNLGDIMKESAQIGISYIRSRTEKLGIEHDFYKTRDIHIHFPEGAVPKDGPSAGVAMAMATISALTGAPAHRNVAMTGEITLRGRILEIGGLREKTMAALRAGVKTVIIPADNERDLEEIDQSVRRSLEFVTASHIDNILDIALDFSALTSAPKMDNIPSPIIGDSKDVKVGIRQ